MQRLLLLTVFTVRYYAMELLIVVRTNSTAKLKYLVLNKPTNKKHQGRETDKNKQTSEGFRIF